MIDSLKIKQLEILRHFKENYYKPKGVSNFLSNNYIEYESNGDTKKNSSLDKYPNKIVPYLRNITIDVQNSDT